ncbi:hypothetical protein RE628_11255 [Paenibacillus sp. D2_2]|uniref:hypothetical protein n=1 Tax=Paenibacillus sp. D2_2 TaxID=3073092 RepID=UPI002815319E|nr:hypothetical protein [Paenibacillus sp. D2_2]WMT42804.1 hypothetical protein RE628_11255 [Paenibacillus sp. D2_2]
MTVRIRFSESQDDQRAMTKAGGQIVVPKDKKPMFSFPSEYHYRQYLTYRREMKNAQGGNQGRN